MPIQLKLSTRAHHNYPAYAKAFRIICALSRASETIQPATQLMGIISNPKSLTKNQQNAKIQRPINQSLFHAQQKTTGLESTDGLTNIAANRFWQDFDILLGFWSVEWAPSPDFPSFYKKLSSHGLVDRVFSVLVAFWLAALFFNWISPVFMGF